MSIESRVFSSIAEVQRMNSYMAKATDMEKDGKCPFNEYHLFFILERYRLLKLRDPNYKKSASTSSDEVSFNGYEGLVLPELPQRYQGIVLPSNWFVPGKKRKRSHKKTHGLVSFQELSRNASKEWKKLDRVTKAYLKDVADTLRDRHLENLVREQFLAPMEKDHNTNTVVTPPSSPSPSPAQSEQIPSVNSTREASAPLRFSFSSLEMFKALRALESSQKVPSKIKEVGMDDDDIMAIWYCTRINDN